MSSSTSPALYRPKQMTLTHPLGTVIRNTSDARKGTPIAVAHEGGKTYCYFTDRDGYLRRVVKTKSSWGCSASVPGADAVDVKSQLSVATSGDTHHLFYVARGHKVAHHRDLID
jgi:hypothetical protein